MTPRTTNIKIITFIAECIALSLLNSIYHNIHCLTVFVKRTNTVLGMQLFIILKSKQVFYLSLHLKTDNSLSRKKVMTFFFKIQQLVAV